MKMETSKAEENMETEPMENGADMSPPGYDQTDFDDTPQFIDMDAVTEVKVDDDVPMDDEDDEVDGANADMGDEVESTEDVVDMSKTKIESHSDSVYAVSCFMSKSENGSQQVLSVLSGGGDDKSFLHRIVADNNGTPTSSSLPLPFTHTDTVSCSAFNLDFVSADLKKTPRLAAIGSFDGNILLYDPDSGEQKLRLEGPTDVEWLCFHPKGGSVLLAGSGDGTVWMFHVPLNKCLQVFVGHEQGVSAGAFSPDGKWALSASADGTLRIWAPKTGVSKHMFRFGNPNEEQAGLTCMATHGGSDGQLVMVGAEDGMAHVCHIGTKKVVASLRHFDQPLNPTNGGDEDEEMQFPMSVEAVGFSPNNPNWCATGGVDGKLKIWDLARDGQCRHTCKTEEENDGITRLRWHPTLPVIFVATGRGRIYTWDARNGNLLHTLTGHTNIVNEMDLHFMQDGNAVIVSAGDDKTIRVFDVDVGAIMQQQAAA